VVSTATVGLVEYDADEILARMRADRESAWPDKLLDALARLPSVELTAMELRCLLYASHGLEADETATVRGVALETVRGQLKQARRKLAAKNTAHAVAIALRAGLIV
jgi:DNA-binding CsgD family transcriptional regulator